MAAVPTCGPLAITALYAAVVACAIASPAAAQDLPAIRYTTADGLPADEVIRALHDPAGFLWLGTSSALARFDGHAFKTYGRGEGLDVATGVNDLRFDAEGRLWISTNGNGIVRFDLTAADASARWTRLPVGSSRASNRVNTFTLTADEVWAGTDAGLFVGRRDAQAFARFNLPLPEQRPQDALQVLAIAQQGGTLWLGTSLGLYRCHTAGARVCARVSPEPATALLVDAADRLWIGGDRGLKVWPLTDGTTVGFPRELGGGSVLRMSRAADGSIFAGTLDGRVLIATEAGARPFFDTDTQAPVFDIVEDRAGNVWLGTRRGLVCVRRQGVSLYSARHGLREPHVRAVLRDRQDREYALTEGHYLHRVDGDRLLSVRLLLPGGVGRSLWLGSALIDARGDVWLGTARGLYRYSNVRFLSDRTAEYGPSAAYTAAHGLAGDHIVSIFEDRSGHLWIASVPGGPDALAVRRAGSPAFERVGVADGMPAFNHPTHFFEDAHGTLWASLRDGGVVRLRERRATLFGAEHGLPSRIDDGLADRDGRLWFGGADSVVRVVDPDSEPFRAGVAVPRLPGRTRVMTDGGAGEIFVGTDRGLLAIDVRSGTLARRYTTFDGLPSGSVEVLGRGSRGTLLLAAGTGLVRLDPARRVRLPRAIRSVISGVRAGETPLALAETGTARLEGVELHPDRNHVEVEFLGLSPHIGEPLTYEYRLGDFAEWRAASDRRVAYTGLAPGRYRFEVRARAADDGAVSDAAVMSFRVLPPWYLTWWFLTGTTGLLVAIGYAGHRVRLRQAVAAEQLRSRIATDLHDDLGASLSQIAVFSELLRRRAGMTAEEADGVLDRIGRTSRELVASMNDIVWAVNPRSDSLADLVARMRRFSEDLFAQGDVDFDFTSPGGLEGQRVGPVVKRELFLVLKEAVTNIAKHARCTRARVTVGVRGRALTLRVWDDGRGFDPEAVHEGHGIRSLRTRVARLTGRLSIASAPAQGTEVTIEVPLR